jgi:hypothetical protein
VSTTFSPPSMHPLISMGLVRAMANVQPVQKRGRNRDDDYAYVEAEDLIAAGKPVLAAESLAIYSEPLVSPDMRTIIRRSWLVHSCGAMQQLADLLWPVVVNGKTVDKAVAAAITTSLGYVYRGALGIACNEHMDASRPSRPANAPRETHEEQDDPTVVEQVLQDCVSPPLRGARKPVQSALSRAQARKANLLASASAPPVTIEAGDEQRERERLEDEHAARLDLEAQADDRPAVADPDWLADEQNNGPGSQPAAESSRGGGEGGGSDPPARAVVHAEGVLPSAPSPGASGKSGKPAEESATVGRTDAPDQPTAGAAPLHAAGDTTKHGADESADGHQGSAGRGAPGEGGCGQEPGGPAPGADGDGAGGRLSASGPRGGPEPGRRLTNPGPSAGAEGTPPALPPAEVPVYERVPAATLASPSASPLRNLAEAVAKLGPCLTCGDTPCSCPAVAVESADADAVVAPMSKASAGLSCKAWADSWIGVVFRRRRMRDGADRLHCCACKCEITLGMYGTRPTDSKPEHVHEVCVNEARAGRDPRKQGAAA